MRTAYYDRDADVAWFPISESDDVVSQPIHDWLIDRDRASGATAAIEVRNANLHVPLAVLLALPEPPE